MCFRSGCTNRNSGKRRIRSIFRCQGPHTAQAFSDTPKQQGNQQLYNDIYRVQRGQTAQIGALVRCDEMDIMQMNRVGLVFSSIKIKLTARTVSLFNRSSTPHGCHRFITFGFHEILLVIQTVWNTGLHTLHFVQVTHREYLVPQYRPLLAR